MNNPLKYFSELRDPRVERNREHLEEILLIAIAAVLSGVESWNDIADYGRIDSPYLLLSNGSLPHRKCYPTWSTTLEGGGDEETNQVDDASGTDRGYQPPLPSSGSK